MIKQEGREVERKFISIQISLIPIWQSAIWIISDFHFIDSKLSKLGDHLKGMSNSI